MKNYYLRIFIIFCLLLTGINSFAQSAKKYYKSAKELSKTGNYDEAVDNYTKAIELDPKFINAYTERALAYEELGQIKEAAADYESLTELLPNEYMWFYKAALLQYKLNKYTIAISLLKSAAELEQNDAKIPELKMRCLLALNNYKSALTESNQATKLNPSAENYYYRGIIQKKLESYVMSESDFTESLKVDPKYINSFIGLSVVRLKQNKSDAALEAVNKAIQIDPNNKEALILRSQINKMKKDFTSAMDDLSKLILVFPLDVDILNQRGLIYMEINQLQNAHNDFSKVLNIDSKNKTALYQRALINQKLGKLSEATKDYENLLSTRITKEDTAQMYAIATQKLFELKKEKEAPVISIIQEKSIGENSIAIPENKDEIQFRLSVTDKSAINKILIDGNPIKFNQDSLSTGFIVSINIKNKKKIIVEGEDIYKNKSLAEFKLIRIESNLPTIALISHTVSKKNEIFIDPKISEFLIEGRIMDESKIASIEINGISAKFNRQEVNPKFSVKPDTSNTEKLEFIVKDMHGNTLVKVYKINRNMMELFAENPMGNTWVVFIENSNYNTFTSIKGPEKDVSMMKNALSKYQINNILHKKNMTKSQMEKFFNSELRDLVRENQVNSILIWYAGIGKYTNEKSYWIPSDAKRDDELSYFNINSLKSSMQAYSKNITHTLIVTDACETGPSFYMSMRSLPTDRDCNNPKATKFKSSQVFTNSGYNLADEDTQFTKTFANSLIFNNEGCIPIEKIVTKVSSVVVQNNNQKPKFGKISGFEDENGTFIFIKK